MSPHMQSQAKRSKASFCNFSFLHLAVAVLCHIAYSHEMLVISQLASCCALDCGQIKIWSHNLDKIFFNNQHSLKLELPCGRMSNTHCCWHLLLYYTEMVMWWTGASHCNVFPLLSYINVLLVCTCNVDLSQLIHIHRQKPKPKSQDGIPEIILPSPSDFGRKGLPYLDLVKKHIHLGQ